MNYILAGWQTLTEYLSAHVLTCLIPAFFIAGAITVFVSQASVVKYFGAEAKKALAYGVASVSGTILAVCSCTILPLFAGIRQRGAGLGPASTFLYAGPAINILAIIYSAQLLGLDLGAARAIGAIAFSIVIGVIMALLFRKSEKKRNEKNGDIVVIEEEKRQSFRQIIIYFALMVMFLVSASSIGLVINIDLTSGGEGILSFSGRWLPATLASILLVLTIVVVVRWFSGDEVTEWFAETWKLAWKIFPILLAGVFIAGIAKEFLPEETVRHWVGGNSLMNNLLASIFGALMYFSTLTEVPIVRALMDLGMGKGPALTLLLAGPSLSLPNMIVIGRIIGFARTAVYVVLVIMLSTIGGLIFGLMAN